MNIVGYEDYAENSNVELLQRGKATHSTKRKVFTDQAYYDTVFEQYELDVPCYDNDTSLPELVSATVRPIYEFYQIPGAEQMPRGYDEESPGERSKRFSNNRTPRWQEPEGGYERARDQSDEYIHTVYVSRGPSDSGQNDFSPHCVFEEHYVFDVFEKADEARVAPPEYHSDSDWTGPIITEVTDSEDEQVSGDDGEAADGAGDAQKKTSPSGNIRPPEKLAKGMSTVSNAGVSHIPAAGPANEHIAFLQSPEIVNEELSKGIRPAGPGLNRLTGLRGTITGNIYNQDLGDGDDFLWQHKHYKFNDFPGQMLLKTSSVDRKPKMAPQALCSVPLRESVLLTGAFDGVGTMGPAGPMAFTLNESFDPYSISVLDTLDVNMYPAHDYDTIMGLPYQANQRQILLANQMGMKDPYGDGILTAISHHNKLIDQFPPKVNAQYFHPRVAYSPEEYAKFHQYAPPVNGRFVSPPLTVTANVDRVRRLREQQNRLQGLRRAGLTPTQVRHVGMQGQQPYELTPPQNEFLARRRDFYRASNEDFLDEVYQARPRVRVPFDRVNVTVSARPAGRFVDETTEVLEKLNDIYQYVLTKPTVGQVKTKIEEVHQSVHSRDVNDFFSLSSMTDFLDYNVKGGRLRPIHLGPQQRPTIQPVAPNFPNSQPLPGMPHNVRLINDRQERPRGFFASRPVQRPLNMRGPRIPRVGLRDVNTECENCFEF